MHWRVLRALKHMRSVKPMVGLQFSQLQVVAVAYGWQPVKRFSYVVAKGCIPVLDGNFEVLKSPIGDTTFCHTFCEKMVAKQSKLLTFLVELGDPKWFIIWESGVSIGVRWIIWHEQHHNQWLSRRPPLLIRPCSMRSPRLATWFYLNHNVHILALVLKREVWECRCSIQCL